MMIRPMPLDSPQPAPEKPGIGHNNGPPFEAMPTWRLHCWRKAHRRAWRNPPREVLFRQIDRARELGLTHREYVLLWMQTGQWK